MESFGYLFVDMKNPDMEIRSDIDKEEREGGIPFFGFDHTIKVPDMLGFRGDGVPFHGAVKISKQADGNSPSIQKLLCLMMPIPEMTMKWFKNDDSGKPVQVYQVRLELCQILGVRTFVEDVREVEQARITEQIEIHYRRIHWEAGNGEGQFFDFDTRTSITPGQTR